MAALIRERPEMLRQVDESGSTPLHHAAAFKAPLEIVQLLVRAWDRGLRERNHFGFLPLTIALGVQAPLEVVRFLVQSYRQSINERSLVDGTIALHHAVEGLAELAVVKFLAEEEPEALQKKDNRGRVPLHGAAHVATLAVVQFLAEASASTLREKMNDGRLPLHLAARHRDLDVVKLLVNKWPDAIFVKDASGRTPFDAARSGLKVANALWLAERAMEMITSTCVVCRDERADHIFLPCCHMCVCGGCARSLQASYAGRRGGNRAPRQKAECPICRAIATECERVHLPGSSM
jgi:ankyrin repeat protein